MPLIRKTAAAADIMDIGEIEEKILSVLSAMGTLCRSIM